MPGKRPKGSRTRALPRKATPTMTTKVTTYYVEGSGVELAIRQHPRRLAGQPLRIGVVGLGTGTVAGWGESGDEIRFFEIDPVVIGISQRNFTYIAESKATSTMRFSWISRPFRLPLAVR